MALWKSENRQSALHLWELEQARVSYFFHWDPCFVSAQGSESEWVSSHSHEGSKHKMCLLPSLGLITQLGHDHILVSQSVLVIVSDLHEVTMGVSNCTKLYGNCIKIVHISKMKRLSYSPHSALCCWYDKAFKDVSHISFFFFLTCKVVC